jgi:hypothetical protein
MLDCIIYSFVYGDRTSKKVPTWKEGNREVGYGDVKWIMCFTFVSIGRLYVSSEPVASFTRKLVIHSGMKKKRGHNIWVPHNCAIYYLVS